MTLLESGSDVKFVTSNGNIHIKHISDIHPIMDERMFQLSSNPKITMVFYQFHIDGELFLIEKLPKTNPNVDIVQSLIHGIFTLLTFMIGIHIITKEQTMEESQDSQETQEIKNVKA